MAINMVIDMFSLCSRTEPLLLLLLSLSLLLKVPLYHNVLQRTSTLGDVILNVGDLRGWHMQWSILQHIPQWYTSFIQSVILEHRPTILRDISSPGTTLYYLDIVLRFIILILINS